LSQFGDTLVLFLLIGVTLYLIIRKWLPFSFSKKRNDRETGNASFRIGRVPSILKKYGYEVIEGKTKVPIHIEFDGEDYASRLFVDYMAQSGDDTYLVLVGRQRKPLRLSGVALRERFLALYLLFEPAGILYVEPDSEQIKIVHFDVPDFKSKKTQRIRNYAIALGIGALLALLIRVG
jgi:hypothetical protein